MIVYDVLCIIKFNNEISIKEGIDLYGIIDIMPFVNDALFNFIHSS